MSSSSNNTNQSNYFLVITACSVLSDDTNKFLNHIITHHCGSALVCNRLGDVAIEYELERNAPDLLAVLREQFVDKRLDFNIVPEHERKKKLLLADMDSTLIANECIDELASVMGIKDQVSTITEKAMAGELGFIQSFIERVALLKGLPETALKEIYDQKITLNPGAKMLGQTLKKYDVTTVIVSGGFDFLTSRVANATGFQQDFSNSLDIKNGELTGLIKQPIMGSESKRSILESLCIENNIKPIQSLCVGDGANDIPMIRAAGLGVAYHAKPKLNKNADALIQYADLTALLYLQGYHQEEFA